MNKPKQYWGREEEEGEDGVERNGMVWYGMYDTPRANGAYTRLILHTSLLFIVHQEFLRGRDPFRSGLWLYGPKRPFGSVLPAP